MDVIEEDKLVVNRDVKHKQIILTLNLTIILKILKFCLIIYGENLKSQSMKDLCNSKIHPSEELCTSEIHVTGGDANVLDNTKAC
jgi:hypothetical protein